MWQETAAWPDFRQAMQRVFPKRYLSADPCHNTERWTNLPGLCCQAAGGDPAFWADHLGQVWYCFYTAAHLLDNIEDQDALEGELSSWPPGVPVNLATGILFTAALALDGFHSTEPGRLASARIPAEFYNGFLVMCGGQHMDLVTPEPSLEQWQQIAAAKSGVFFRLACWGGAALAAESLELLEAYGEFGFRLGLLLQLQDDLGDLHKFAGQGDLLLSASVGRSLPVAYAREVLPENVQIRLSDLMVKGAHDPLAAGQVIKMLTQCGADLYVLTEIERHIRVGSEALQAARPQQPARDKLLGLLRDLGSDSPTGA